MQLRTGSRLTCVRLSALAEVLDVHVLSQRTVSHFCAVLVICWS